MSIDSVVAAPKRRDTGLSNVQKAMVAGGTGAVGALAISKLPPGQALVALASGVGGSLATVGATRGFLALGVDRDKAPVVGTVAAAGGVLAGTALIASRAGSLAPMVKFAGALGLIGSIAGGLGMQHP